MKPQSHINESILVVLHSVCRTGSCVYRNSKYFEYVIETKNNNCKTNMFPRDSHIGFYAKDEGNTWNLIESEVGIAFGMQFMMLHSPISFFLLSFILRHLVHDVYAVRVHRDVFSSPIIGLVQQVNLYNTSLTIYA